MYRNSLVQELGTDDFKRHKQQNIIYHRNKNGKHQGIIKFYTSWCGHCKNFHKSMLNLANQGIPMKALDCEQYNSLSQKLGVNGYPTLGFVNKKGQIFKYEGSRREDEITKAYQEFQSNNEK